MTKPLRPMLLLPLALLVASAASATTVDLQFHGTIETLVHPELLEGSGIQVGSLFGGQLVVYGDGAELYPADALYPGGPAFYAQTSMPFLVGLFGEVGTPTYDESGVPELPSYSSTYGLILTGPIANGSTFAAPGDWIWNPFGYPQRASTDRFEISIGFVDRDSTRSLDDDIAQAVLPFDSWDAAYFFVLYNPGHTAGAAPTDTYVLAYGTLHEGNLHIPVAPEPALVPPLAALGVGGALLRRRGARPLS